MILDTERGSIRSLSVQNWLWKRLWTCRKADYGMSEYPVGDYVITSGLDSRPHTVSKISYHGGRFVTVTKLGDFKT
jgi:hypothetical protein